MSTDDNNNLWGENQGVCVEIQVVKREVVERVVVHFVGGRESHTALMDVDKRLPTVLLPPKLVLRHDRPVLLLHPQPLQLRLENSSEVSGEGITHRTACLSNPCRVIGAQSSESSKGQMAHLVGGRKSHRALMKINKRLPPLLLAAQLVLCHDRSVLVLDPRPLELRAEASTEFA